MLGEIGISDGTLYIEDTSRPRPGESGAVGTSGIDVPSRIERLDASLELAVEAAPQRGLEGLALSERSESKE